MIKKFLIAVVSAAALCSATAAEWLTDLPKAEAQAEKEKKLVLLNFTGSDWCPGCITLKRDVLDTKEFKDYADKNLVLVEVDFPRQKKLDEKQEKENEALEKKFDVEGYPTLVILNQKGKEVGRESGYLEGGPKAFIEKLEKAKKK